MEQVLVGKEELTRQFEDFFNARKKQQVSELASNFPLKKSLELDYHELEVFDTELADAVVESPDKLIAIGEEVLANIGSSLPTAKKNFKPHLRIFNLPDVHNVSVQNLGAGQLDKLVRVEGVVSWITDINPRMQVATWECMHCWEITTTKTEKVEPVKPPVQCKCGRNHFNLLEERSVFINVQRARMQEMVEKLRGNTPTAHVDLWLEDDIANLIAPGEKLTIVGVLRLKPAKEGKGKSSVYNKFLDVVHVHKLQQEFEELTITKEEEKQIKELAGQPDIFERITKSIAPSIYGYNELKQAIALQMFGGTPGKTLPDGQRIRNDAHILLIGDPGCLVADERIALGNGAIVKIGEVGQNHLQKLNLSVLTGEGGGKRDNATTFFAYKKQPIIEVITESGKSIKGTYNHPLLCLENQNSSVTRKWKQLDEIKKGDRLATVNYIPCKITSQIPTGFKPVAYHRGPRFRGKLPSTVAPELAEVLGYMLGDGWVRKKEASFIVAESEKDILEPLRDKCRTLFGIEAHVTKRKLNQGRTVQMYVGVISSKDVAHNLLFLRDKRVPNLILQSGNKVAAAFLRWLFEADGTVFNNGRGRRAIGLKAKNVELLRDVQMLLLRFSVHSRIIENALLIRRRKDILKFAKSIGFVSKKKKTKLKNLAKSAREFSRVGQQFSERIVKIIHHPPEDVFDIEVPNSHRFIANGIISHNSGKSAILQYVSRLAPKGIFVSGKGASGVGLTASAEKDELTGGWILKAGAMVLASGGMIMIDEFDKIETEDRSALHEGMEQQSYHYSTNILLADGREAEIGKLVEELMEKNKENIIKGVNCEILKLSPDEIKILTTDFGKIYPTSAAQVSRHTAPDLFYKVKTVMGQSVLVTPEHPFWVLTADGIKTKPANQLTNSDCTAVPTYQPTKGKEQIELVEKLMQGTIAWSKITEVTQIPNDGQKWVYDIGVDETHSFIAHNLVLHNSISIAKAGMITTFQTKASVLAAANPKFGRFDPNTPPASQFEIPPTLLSRFDLIFTIRDVLDEAQDRKIAEHIILGHTIAGKKEKPSEDSAILPTIDSDLLRKYIAYARRSCFPTLTAEASEKIKEFYLELRQLGKKNNTFPVTARQIEGVIRFAEASAKVRLSPRVELQDAERSVALAMFVLHDVFTDKETGLIDSDIISIGQPKSKVDKIRTLLGIISSLESKFDLVDIDDVVKEAEGSNVDEHTARKMIDELKRQGDLYEPKAGFVKSARKKGEW